MFNYHQFMFKLSEIIDFKQFLTHIKQKREVNLSLCDSGGINTHLDNQYLMRKCVTTWTW